MFAIEEYTIQCLHCWEQITINLDTSVENQEYIEDCEVCCNPMKISVVTEAGTIKSVMATSLEQ